MRFRSRANAASTASVNGGSLKAEILDRLFVMSVPAGRELNVISALSQNPNVEFAEPDYIRTYGLPCSLGDCAAPLDTYFGYKCATDWLDTKASYSNAGNEIDVSAPGGADDLGTSGWDKSFGHGRINVYRAINDLR